jgi:hypothetical protein
MLSIYICRKIEKQENETSSHFNGYNCCSASYRCSMVLFLEVEEQKASNKNITTK